MALKCVIGDPKTGKCKQVELESSDSLQDRVIGEKVTLDVPELSGYEFQITGGSDASGFPMRFDVDEEKKRILAVSGVGVKKKRHGQRQRKMVAGKRVHNGTAQLNLKITKYGKQPLFEEPKAEEPAQEAKEE